MTATAQSLIELANKSQRWMRDRPLLLDVIFALIILLVELVDLFAVDDALIREPDVLAISLLCLGAGALVWRRHRPVAVLTFMTAVLCIYYVRDYGSFMSFAGLAGFYAVAAHGANRRHAWTAIGVFGVVLYATALATLLRVDGATEYPAAASMFLSICVAVFVGVVARNHEQIFKQAEARADEAEADRSAAAERARNEERLRIARELHDVVAHGMSVIAVQAAAAQEIAPTDPERAIELMQTVETTGRESLREMRRMLGVLRNTDADGTGAGATRGPQPSLADIELTIEHCRDAGLETTFEITGKARPISPGLELTVFRIIQEALTNVLKHGGSAATASVELSYRDTTLLVRVADTGRGAAVRLSRSDPGNGLVGMRERVELYDGSLTAGPQPGGGYTVTAVIPLEQLREPGVVSTKSQPTGSPT